MLDDVAVLAAFSEEQVEKLTRLKKSRLRYWARTGFFTPSLLESGQENRIRIYTLRDVAALRILEVLRVQNNVPLQHLRLVAEKLSGDPTEKWIKTTLYVVNRKVVFHRPGEDLSEEVVGGKYVLGIPLKQIVDDTRSDLAGLRRRGRNEIGQVVSMRKISGGPVIGGTRIGADSVRRLAEDGYTHEQIIAEYPDLVLEDIKAVLRSQAELLEPTSKPENFCRPMRS